MAAWTSGSGSKSLRIMTTTRRFHIITYGCQMNEHDSERMAGLLSADGFTWTESPENADLVIINSCTIRSKAEEKAFSEAGRLKGLKKHNPNLRIGLCGCVAQREREHILGRAPHIDLVFGTLNIPRLPVLVKRLDEEGGRICEVADEPVDTGPCNPCRALRAHSVKAWITIMEGCNNFCSYCVVPYVRGRERSRSPEDIEREVVSLVQAGYKEVTLLGQNVNSYGMGLTLRFSFPDLLCRLNEIPGLERIRFTTSHPKDLSCDLVHAMKTCEKVCEHIHLPLQAGSDNVLKRMGRGYTVEEYLAKIDALREAMPEIAITGDMICGFPGETEGDFERTLAIVERIRFDGLFSFKYSARPQTSASRLSDHLPEEIKLSRLKQLQTLQNRICGEINAMMVGSHLPILVEGPSKKDPAKLTGRTRTNKVVNVPGPTALIGSTVTVRIARAKPFDLEGERIVQKCPF